MPHAQLPPTPEQRLVWFAPLIHEHARRTSLSAAVLAALILTESDANPYAIRPEPGYWKRYGKAVVNLLSLTPSKQDDRWASYPDLAGAAYGLCQVQYGTAISLQFDLEFPTQLCDPETNLLVATSWLAHLERQHPLTTHDLLQRYNGGGDPEYASRVLALVSYAAHALSTPT